MHLYAGTSGFSYKSWKGAFYPEDLKDDQMLRYYSEHLPAVELNNTFYRMPKRDVVERWAEAATADFRFVIKASRFITHIKRLRETEQPLAHLLDVLEPLGRRLGPVLFQLPPNFKCDVARLSAFLEGLPPGVRAVFEFRHESWFRDAVTDALRNRGVALCTVETDEVTREPVETTDWGYVRLRKMDYSDDALRAWIDRLRQLDWREVYVFFKHEEAATGPATARRFLDLAG